MTQNDDSCEIEEKLHEIHLWLHACIRELRPEKRERIHEIGQRIIDLLNEIPASDVIKLVALFEAISVAADVLEQTSYRADSTVTVH